MKAITEEQYKFALRRVEKLLPQVSDNTPLDDSRVIELSLMSDIVIEYEEVHYPIEVPKVSLALASSICRILHIKPAAMMRL